jgi:hypothetical protein
MMRGDINTPVADDPALCQNAGLLSNALEVGKRLFVDDRSAFWVCLWATQLTKAQLIVCWWFVN